MLVLTKQPYFSTRMSFSAFKRWWQLAASVCAGVMGLTSPPELPDGSWPTLIILAVLDAVVMPETLRLRLIALGVKGVPPAPGLRG
jgi:hypothetical protein